MKIVSRIIACFLCFVMLCTLLSVTLPQIATAEGMQEPMTVLGKPIFDEAEEMPSSTAAIHANSAPQMNSGNLKTPKPTKEDIRRKWDEVTTATTVFNTEPSIVAPYAIGELHDSFLESGITYLNYVRYVANLPAVRLTDAQNESAQYGAVLMAAIDTMTHYPTQPDDMDDAFYNRGYAATTSSNLSARWGYAPLSCLQGAVSGCMDDSSSVSNLSCVGHRRWLLNPTLLNVGFGYAESETGWSYIDTTVFDRSGAAVDYDYVSWPASGNFPTNLFNTSAPWSITLNPAKYKKPSLDSVQVTITRVSDGKTWSFDGNTGAAQSTSQAYLEVNNQGYGVSNCIIFHPGNRNIDAYNGLFTVDVSGIYYLDSSPATLHYEVEFFDVMSICLAHSYSTVITAPTCTEQGYSTHTCTVCGDTYVDAYVAALGHNEETDKAVSPTCTKTGLTEGKHCNRCSTVLIAQYVVDALGHDEVTDKAVAATCTTTGLTEGKHCDRCGEVLVAQQTVPAKGHTPGAAATCTESQKCTICGEVLKAALGHDLVHHDAQEPTYTEIGWNAYDTCTRCDYSTYVELPKLDGVQFVGASLSLKGDIGLNFFAIIPDEIRLDENAVMRFTVGSTVKTVPLSQGTLDPSDGSYRYSIPLNAKNMGDEVTAQVYIGDTPVGGTKTLSIKTYADYAIANSSNKKLVNLMKAMLNYGAAAQMNFGYDTEHLVNGDMAEADRTLPATLDVSGYVHTWSGEETGLEVTNASLLLQSETKIRIYFKLKEGYELSDFTFTIDGIEVTPVQSGDEYYIEKTNVAAKDLDTMYTFCLGGRQLVYCGMSYVNQVLSYSSDENLINLAKALYAYNQAANVYFDK